MLRICDQGNDMLDIAWRYFDQSTVFFTINDYCEIIIYNYCIRIKIFLCNNGIYGIAAHRHNYFIALDSCSLFVTVHSFVAIFLNGWRVDHIIVMATSTSISLQMYTADEGDEAVFSFNGHLKPFISLHKSPRQWTIFKQPDRPTYARVSIVRN